MIQLLLNKTTPHFQLLPMTKVDQSLRIHGAPPLQSAKSQRIHLRSALMPRLATEFSPLIEALKWE